MNNQSVFPYGANVNPGGPLSFDYAPLMARLRCTSLTPSMFGTGGDWVPAADMGMQSGNALSAGFTAEHSATLGHCRS